MKNAYQVSFIDSRLSLIPLVDPLGDIKAALWRAAGQETSPEV